MGTLGDTRDPKELHSWRGKRTHRIVHVAPLECRGFVRAVEGSEGDVRCSSSGGGHEGCESNGFEHDVNVERGWDE